jgi:hypothetical protein
MVCLIEAAKVRIIFGSKVILLLSFLLELAYFTRLRLDFFLQCAKNRGLPKNDRYGLIA